MSNEMQSPSGVSRTSSVRRQSERGRSTGLSSLEEEEAAAAAEDEDACGLEAAAVRRELAAAGDAAAAVHAVAAAAVDAVAVVLVAMTECGLHLALLAEVAGAGALRRIVRALQQQFPCVSALDVYLWSAGRRCDEAA